MATLTTIKFSRDNANYEVKIDFDDTAIVDELIAFDIQANVTSNDGIPFSETLRIELDFNNSTGKFFLREEVIHQFSLGGIHPMWDSKGGETIPGIDGNEPLNDEVYNYIEESIGGSIVERVIYAMPVPDPFLGCLIKASISSIVGQAIACNNIRERYGKGRRLTQIFNCLRVHVKGIALRTLWRTARCALGLGLV